jgi:hypothetical protein
MIMEMLDRPHKDVPFGWVLWLQEALERRAAKRATRKAARAPVGRTIDPPRMVYYR